MSASSAIDSRELSDCELALVGGGNEEIRNRRAMDSAAFQAFDETSSELMSALSSVLKTMNGMRGIGSSARSGL